MFELVVFLALLAAGYGFGQAAERSHYRSIRAREDEYRGLIIIQSRVPPAIAPAPQSMLVCGSVVISVDFFKVFVAGLRNIVGGRQTSYESLIDRARREAVLRMKEQAAGAGANVVMNVKFEAAPLYKGQRNAIQSVEAIAYGTALIPAVPSGPPAS
ncbi:MAG: YbjQ family protein [Gammaproteobacteria bacterium]